MLNYGYLRELFEACLEAEYQQVENEGSFAAVRDGEVLWLYFEQSNGAEDWMNNLSYRSVSVGRKDEEWFCHEGFWRVWQSILPHLEPMVLNPATRKIITVGYSHGAALALLCHEYIGYLRKDLEEQREGYGFGCPRVIWGTVPGEGRRWKNFYVVRNIDDAITHLPPRFLGYRHVGRLIQIGRSGRYSAIEAHMADNYIRELIVAESECDK